jgi:hypothetical protein
MDLESLNKLSWDELQEQWDYLQKLREEESFRQNVDTYRGIIQSTFTWWRNVDLNIVDAHDIIFHTPKVKEPEVKDVVFD